ncbi:MAG: short-chain dehydrogenase [Flaviaesturariibacter sp.]|nr:short-chain dehydrogenase [Flaviaesturariibacter sp.]
MNSEDIEKFLNKKATLAEACVKITFKKRASIFGLFLREPDFKDLKSKNFWRIVPESRLTEYNQSKNVSLARIYCGVEFTRLTPYKETFE